MEPLADPGLTAAFDRLSFGNRLGKGLPVPNYCAFEFYHYIRGMRGVNIMPVRQPGRGEFHISVKHPAVDTPIVVPIRNGVIDPAHVGNLEVLLFATGAIGGDLES